MVAYGVGHNGIWTGMPPLRVLTGPILHWDTSEYIHTDPLELGFCSTPMQFSSFILQDGGPRVGRIGSPDSALL